jgi:hypothetical protein
MTRMTMVIHKNIEDLYVVFTGPVLGNCYRVYSDKELIAVLPTKEAAILMVEVFASALPTVCNNVRWTIEKAFVEGIGF